jgi:hypothetical protein
MSKAWPKWVRWAWILPVAELALAFAVAGVSTLHLLRIGWDHPIRRSIGADGRINLVIPSEAEKFWLADEVHKRFPNSFESISYLNLPAVLVEIGISLPTTWPDSWTPSWALVIGLDGFRALSWPLWALPFWFSSGRGVDSYFRNGFNISAFEAFVMALLSAAITVATIGIAVCAPLRDDESYMRWGVVPCAMWIAFGVICQLAWWRQRSVRRAPPEIQSTTE